MDSLSINDIKELVTQHSGLCVSIYMPTLIKGNEVEQNRIRFKNLLCKVEKHLQEKELHHKEIKKYLEPAEQLLNDTYFWSYQNHGLTTFITKNAFYYYRFPIKFNEIIHVSNRFLIKPLIPLLGHESKFFILGLSQKNPRVFQASTYTLNKLQTAGIPQGIQDVLKYESPEKHLQFHTGTAEGKGKRSAMFHGQGDIQDDAVKKKMIKRYCQMLDKGLFELLRNQKSPLLLMGTEPLLSIYKEVNSYPYLFQKVVHENTDEITDKEIHQRALSAIQPYFKQKQSDILLEYRELCNTEKVADDLENIVRAALDHRIDQLFLDPNVNYWGCLEKETHKVSIHEQRQENDENLVDYVVVQTILHGGKVFSFKPEELPDGKPICAILRF